ncbi:MAG: hypothetical protein Tsb0014_36870 [Pleurocapsa sp.]
MNNLKIKNLPTLKQLSADELSQVVGGRSCFKSISKFKRRGGKNKGSDGITASGTVSNGGISIDIGDGEGIIVVGD